MKLGFAVDNLGPSQLNYFLIKAINESVDEVDLDITLFYCTLTKPCLPLRTASMQMTEAFGFNGTMVATNFNTAQKLLRCPSPKRRIFYVHDLEWIRNPVDFETLAEVYRNPQLELITRSEDYAHVLQKLFHRPVLVQTFPSLIHVCKKVSLVDRGKNLS